MLGPGYWILFSDAQLISMLIGLAFKQ